VGIRVLRFVTSLTLLLQEAEGMQAARLVPILAVLLTLVPLESASAQGQRSRCPFCAQAQLQMQMQWQQMFTPAPQPPMPASRPPQTTANQWRGGYNYPLKQFVPRMGGGRTSASQQRTNYRMTAWTPRTSTTVRRFTTIHRTTTHLTRFT
jgi:hypothetical protein